MSLRIAACVASTALLLVAAEGPAQAAVSANKNCGDLRVSGSPGGLYSVRVNRTAISCRTSRSVVRRYLRNKAPRTATVDGWRCSYNRKGTVAEGTAFKVTCRKGDRRIEGFYRGA